MMTIREYKRAESLEEAWQLNQKKANRILGGMIWLKMETINVGTAIDLSGLGLDTIEETVGKVEVQSPQTVAAYRQRLEAKMQEVLQSTTIDESRILTEAAIFADKVAVDEETVRLRSHIAQLRDMLQSSEPVGRKLDFLIQEVNRECNTIGSKCNDLTVARDVVNMKAEVEKGMLIDATYGRKTASVLIMDSDHVVLSALAAERLAPRLGMTVADMTEEE